MSFQILLGDKGNVDFNAPVEMTREEREGFIQLLRSIFASSVIKENVVEEFRDWRMGGNRIQYPREWTAEENEILLQSHTIQEAIDRLGRSGMAIIVQDGKWRPEFFQWCHKNKKNPLGGIEVIKEFMKEKKDLTKTKKKRKKELREKKKKIEELKEQLRFWDSEMIRNQLDLAKKFGKIQGSIDEYIEIKKNEIKFQIQQLEKELEKENSNS